MRMCHLFNTSIALESGNSICNMKFELIQTYRNMQKRATKNSNRKMLSSLWMLTFDLPFMIETSCARMQRANTSSEMVFFALAFAISIAGKGGKYSSAHIVGTYSEFKSKLFLFLGRLSGHTHMKLQPQRSQSINKGGIKLLDTFKAHNIFRWEFKRKIECQRRNNAAVLQIGTLQEHYQACFPPC